VRDRLDAAVSPDRPDFFYSRPPAEIQFPGVAGHNEADDEAAADRDTYYFPTDVRRLRERHWLWPNDAKNPFMSLRKAAAAERQRYYLNSR
jgi:hypothetical protein